MNISDLSDLLRQVRENPKRIALVFVIVVLVGTGALYQGFCSEKGRQLASEPSESERGITKTPPDETPNIKSRVEPANGENKSPTIQQTTTGTGSVAIVGNGNTVETTVQDDKIKGTDK